MGRAWWLWEKLGHKGWGWTISWAVQQGERSGNLPWSHHRRGGAYVHLPPNFLVLWPLSACQCLASVLAPADCCLGCAAGTSFSMQVFLI